MNLLQLYCVAPVGRLLGATRAWKRGAPRDSRTISVFAILYVMWRGIHACEVYGTGLYVEPPLESELYAEPGLFPVEPAPKEVICQTVN